MSELVASRIFTEADQHRFAALSGDFNPIHVDRVAARRTAAGTLVVHGVHNLLWCLDSVARRLPNAGPVASLRANFDSFVTVGEAAEAVLVQSDAARLRAEVRVRGALALTAILGFGPPKAEAAALPDARLDPDSPLDLPPSDLAALLARLDFVTPAAEITAAFPDAARLLGAGRVAALACHTRLIGMVCPGLHSIFNKIALDTTEEDGGEAIGFRVTMLSPEHRRLVASVWGGGWTGSLTATLRHRPAAQPGTAALRRHVTPGEFAGATTLVVGGSRGLGEVAAKLIAAGGGMPIVTYARGKADAEAVAADIRAAGGRCEVARFDIGEPVPEQLRSLPATPNQLLYFATPMIGRRKASLFDPDQFATFVRFYVTAFHDTCRALAANGGRLAALYPSTVYVEDRPPGLAEYAMAKAAGEQLCREINAGMANVTAIIARLPRLATDQNPGLSDEDEVPSAPDVLLPLLRQLMQAA